MSKYSTKMHVIPGNAHNIMKFMNYNTRQIVTGFNSIEKTLGKMKSVMAAVVVMQIIERIRSYNTIDRIDELERKLRQLEEDTECDA